MFLIVAMARRSDVSGAQVDVLIAVPVSVDGFNAILEPVADFDAVRVLFLFSIRGQTNERVLVEADPMRNHRLVRLLPRLRVTVHYVINKKLRVLLFLSTF